MKAPRATILLYCSCLCAVLAAGPLRADEKALVEAGVPPLGRAWNGREYTRAAGLLKSSKVPLPRYSDPQGRWFLQRLTAADNLSFSGDEKMPLDSRFNDFLAMLSGANIIMLQYVSAINRGDNNAHAECAGMMAFMLRTAAVGVHLIGELEPTFAKDDKYPARIEGLNKLRSHLVGIFSGAEQSVSENSVYEAQDLSVLLDAMAETLPTLKAGFSDGFKSEVRQKLEAEKAMFPQPRDAQDIQKMIGELGP